MTKKLLSINGKQTVTEFHRELGKVMWNNVGMARSKESLTEALKEIPAIREEFWKNVKVTGTGAEFNQQLENAGRVADFLEFGELLCRDALHRDESCGGHFRVEHQTPDGEAKRNDANFSYVAAWEFKGVDKEPELHKEPLEFENYPSRGKELQIMSDIDKTMTSETDRLAPEGAGRTGQIRNLHREEHNRAPFLSRDARRGERRPDQGRQGADRLRPRLPRRDLRHLLPGHQRRSPRRAGADHRLPAPHAQVQGWRHHLHRTVAGAGLPDHQRPDRRPLRP